MHISILSLGLLATQVLGHGLITKPWPRTPGALSLAACGPTVTNNIKGDNTSHVEGLPEAAMTDAKYNAAECNLWLCRGLQLEESAKANVIAYTPGQKVSMSVKISIKHHGTANVSIISTKTNKIIGDELLYWDKYADERLPAMPANNTQFDVVIPTTLGSQCANAGDCVLQWWWYGTAARQTYESCVDFTVAPTMPMLEKRFEA
ncbi:uncharacterized protein LY89DRAFT_639261 [Mollisia scopiformis]|uniref:Chitin-binding type-4 domain-containing protein n=1 Tax=Mollisia scopiformis TaxID=149040 RepID=A0A194XM84_MOLSC|nr:uncharacterized protein LY89DRAFT_639261 [Mollisia scopiformis]KUJ21288.1 hypothetical protein LY89DRAFT_639261 [Mollisia scopiformis]